MLMKKFSNFLLNEDRAYLGNKIGDVLSSMQDIEADLENLGSRHVSRRAESIVNQIRKILHSRWDPKHTHTLEKLRDIAVAIMKTIDEKGDIKQMLPAATQALQTLSGQLGVKINDINAPEQPDTGMEQPDTGMEQPDMGMEQPDMGMEQPDMGMEQPDMGMEQPDMGMEQPDMGI
jgi:hypothetical protein